MGDRPSVFPNGEPTRRDVLTFAEGIIERFEQASPAEVTDEARLIYRLAQFYVEAVPWEA